MGQWQKHLTHQQEHPDDVLFPPGSQRVRIDGGNELTPFAARRYELVRTGYGEGIRARHARGRAARARMCPWVKS